VRLAAAEGADPYNLKKAQVQEALRLIDKTPGQDLCVSGPKDNENGTLLTLRFPTELVCALAMPGPVCVRSTSRVGLVRLRDGLMALYLGPYAKYYSGYDCKVSGALALSAAVDALGGAYTSDAIEKLAALELP
jgi:hypothetical protein